MKDKYEVVRKGNRYVIIDKVTKNVVNNAQGYGYKDVSSAWKALYFQLNRKEIEEKSLIIKKFWEDNKQLDKDITLFQEIEMKDFYRDIENINKKFKSNNRQFTSYIQKYIEDNNIQISVSVNDLYKYRDSCYKIVKQKIKREKKLRKIND